MFSHTYWIKLGWDSKDAEGDLLVGLRETLLVSLVKLGHDKTINEGVKRFDILKHDHNSTILSPHVRKVPNQNAVDVLNGITVEAREIAWTWLKENWDHILRVVPKKELWSSIIDNIVPLFTSNDKVEEIIKFFTNHPEPNLQDVLQNKLRMVHTNMRWIEGIQSEPMLEQTVHELLHKT
ncbi:hypothetical protein VPH35_056398 [Triticum aestivum]